MPVLPQRRGDLQGAKMIGDMTLATLPASMQPAIAYIFLGGAVSKALTTELLHSAIEIPTPSYREECPLGATSLGVQMLLTLGEPQGYSWVYFQVKSESLG